jgi:Ca2+:H+ antiporter
LSPPARILAQAARGLGRRGTLRASDGACAAVALEGGTGLAILDYFGRTTRFLLGAAIVATVTSAVLVVSGGAPVVTFGATAIALAMLASLVGEGTEQLGARQGPAVTGILQSALGNLPELFISLFSLQAGLVVVVQFALIGSILANSLLVLGAAFVVGGLKFGTQRFGARASRSIATLLLLAVGSLVIPTLATAPGAPDAGHAAELSVVVSIVLLVVFAGSLIFSIRRDARPAPATNAPTTSAEAVVDAEGPGHLWPQWLALVVLAGAAVAAAFVSEWFVAALRPAMATLGMSEAFAGLVVVAIAGNAVENVVGIQAAARNQAELAVSLILNSSLQVAIALTPALVIISMLMGVAPLTLVVTPLLAGAVGLSAILAAVIVFDGESNWLEGLALIGLYLIIAASVWWGPGIVA